ncbi:MAG: DUF3084 domain-containing protein [Fimbriimonadaceae bacterium]|jgi:uncharacterized protein (DUF3084 family)|nr:DUF3084 domain-containing protein [Fimbriimonadaceae bacterium]
MDTLIPIGFLVFMALVGGLVATAGDHIGRKIGKARLKVGKMRPKHTAVLGTFLSGMLVTAITVLSIIAFVAPVRDLLFQRERIVRDLADTRASLQAAKSELATSQQALAEQSKKADSLQNEVSTTQATLQTEREKLDRTTQSATAAQSRAREFQTRAQSLLQRTKDLQGKIGPLSGTVQKLSQEATQLEREVATLSSEGQRISGDNSDLQRRNDELTRRNLDLDREIRNGREAITNLQKEIDDLRKAQSTQADSFNQRQVENQRLLEQAERSLRQAENDLSALEAEKSRLEQFLRESSAAVRTAPLMFNREDEIVRISVEPNLSLTEARNLVNSLITRASLEARDRGATAPPGGQAARLVPFTVRGSLISPEEQFEKAARELAGKGRPQLIRAIAPFNSFRGETASIVIDIRPNPVVYAQNERIIEMTVDGRLTEDQIAGQIIEFVGTRLRDQVIRDGMLPAKGKDVSIGELTRDKLLEILIEVRRYGRPARLQFIAAQETRAGDTLRLSYRLRP